MIKNINIIKEEIFLAELDKVSVEVETNLSLGKAKPVIQTYLKDIVQFVHFKGSLAKEVKSYARFRPIYEEKYGEEFLESALGKRFINVCLYFAYAYWPMYNKE